MKKQKVYTRNHYIQIGNNEEVNMNTLTEEERREIGERLGHNLVIGLGYREVKEDKNVTA